MKNIISYYYGFDTFDLVKIKNDYVISYNKNTYYFYKINDLSIIYKKKRILKEVENNKYVHTIIRNRENSILTQNSGNYYILFRVNIKFNKKVDIRDINKFYLVANNLIVFRKNVFQDWILLWSKKIDYLEYFVDKDLNLSDDFRCLINYYIGFGENAIAYLKYYLIRNEVGLNNITAAYVHDRVDVNDTLYDLYNPFNILIDSRVRDVAEYIKSLYLNKRISKDIIGDVINNTNYSKMEYVLLVARVMFPTFFFDRFDNMCDNNSFDEMIKNYDSVMSYEELIKLLIDRINKIKKTNLVIFDWINTIS